jgi:hypothetical protein
MGFTRPDIIVYVKKVYEQSDSMGIFLTAVATLGSLVMALFSRLIINLVGSKTLFIFLMSVATFSLVPAIASPLFTGSVLIAFLVIFNFVSNFGMQGVESNSQTYLFTIIRKDEITTLSIIYYMVYGIGGAIGSILGGFFIDLFPRFNLDIRTTFQLVFGLALVGYLVVLYSLTRLQNNNKHSVRDGLSFILNPKDIKAISLANQLENNTSSNRQIEILQEIARSDSDAPLDIIVESLNSPKLFVRREALFALESIPITRDPVLVKALLLQLEERQGTTGYMAARVVGRNGIKQAIPQLRHIIREVSDSYMLGESIRALARLDDKQSIKEIYNLITPKRPIYIVIQAINALQTLLDIEEVTRLFRPFRWQTLNSDSIGNEVLLSVAGLLNLDEWFYSIYVSYSQSPDEGYAVLNDIYQANRKKCGTSAPIEQLLTRPKSIVFKGLAETLLNNSSLFFAKSEAVQLQLSYAALNPLLFRYSKIRFFFTALFIANHIHK